MMSEESNVRLVQISEGDFVVRKKERDAYLKEKAKKERRCMEGNFTFTDMAKIHKLTTEISATHLGYLFLLQIFIDYGTNELIIHQKTRHMRSLTRRDMIKSLNVSSRTLRDFLKTMKSHSILSEDEAGHFKLNDDFIFRGEIRNRSRNVVKTYDLMAKELYKHTQARGKIKHLGYLVKVMPYLNMTNNIICDNPFEIDVKKINGFTYLKIAELLNVSDKTVMRMLRSFTVGNEVVFAEMTINGNSLIIVNPLIMNRGGVEKGIQEQFLICNQKWNKNR